MFKRYLLLLVCLLFTFTLLVLSTSPVLAQDHSLAFAKPFTDDIYYVQYEWVTLYLNNLFYFIQIGNKSEENYSFLCGKYGFRYYFTADSPQGFYVGGYYNFLQFYRIVYHIDGDTPNQIIPGPVSLAFGAKSVFKNGLSIDLGIQVGDKYVSSADDSGLAIVPGYLVALGYSW